MKPEAFIRTKKEIQALKRRVKDIEERAQLLLKRIREVEQEVIPSPFRAMVDTEQCISCGICLDLCPTGAISIDRIAHIDSAKCIGCGRCAEACPRGAVTAHPMKRSWGEKVRVAS